MSKYTTEVRFICENASGLDESKGFNNVDDIIESAIPVIFSFDFPIFDENYREVICTKILRHYYTREIGLETVGLWKLKLQTKLNEIMPYYNKLYESELLSFNPLYDVDLNTTHIGQKDSENINEQNGTANALTNAESNSSVVGFDKSNETGKSNKDSVNGTNINGSESSYDLYSDTPQGALNGVEDESYLTNARKITKGKIEKNDSVSIDNNNFNVNNENESNRNQHSNDNIISSNTENKRGTDKFNSTESYVLHVAGKQAGTSFSKLLREFRETFLNIDLEVINSLSDLFMNVW